MLDHHGGVSLLVNNAGVTVHGRFADQSLEDVERVLGVNLAGVLYGCRAFLEPLRESRGHIVNARNIPTDELESRLESLSEYKSKPIVAVCDAGISSTRVVNTLRQNGFESAYGLKGGMTGWSQAGLPVVTGKKTKSKSGKNKKRG